MPLGGEAAHVDADLGGDHRCAELADAGNSAQELDAGAKGLEAIIHLPIDLDDGGIEGIDLLEVEASEASGGAW